MGFSQPYSPGGNPPAEPLSPWNSSFDKLSQEELEAHLQVARYGDFFLTDAVRPAYDLKVVPTQGYRCGVYRDDENHVQVPVLMAAASREVLMDLFLDLLEPLGPVVDVVLETSHHRYSGEHQDLYREHIDKPVLMSVLCDYEDLLLNDGCTGVAVLNPQLPAEVQFDEHKLLIVYAQQLEPFQDVFHRHDVFRNDQMSFITEAEHIHSSAPRYYEQFLELAMRLGIEADYDMLAGC